jgi:hypothetical protein
MAWASGQSLGSDQSLPPVAQFSRLMSVIRMSTDSGLAAEDFDADAGNGLNELLLLLDGAAFHHFDVVSGHGVLWVLWLMGFGYRVLRVPGEQARKHV